MAPGRHTFPGVDPELFRWVAEQQALSIAEEEQQPHEEEEDDEDMDEDEEDEDEEVPFSIAAWLLHSCPYI